MSFIVATNVVAQRRPTGAPQTRAKNSNNNPTLIHNNKWINNNKKIYTTNTLIGLWHN